MDKIQQLMDEKAEIQEERDRAVALIRSFCESNGLSPFLQSVVFDKMKELIRELDQNKQEKTSGKAT